MTFDVPTALRLVNKRIQNDFNLSDACTIEDLKEAMELYLNSEIATDFVVGASSFTSASSNVMTAEIYATMLTKAEQIVIERQLQDEINIAITSNTPAGQVNTRYRPEMRALYRRDALDRQYKQMVFHLINGIATGRTTSVDMDQFLQNRDLGATSQ